MSLDGKIATYTGDSKWVTGPLARDEVQRMRRECDAIMVGINTVLADDPQLTARGRWRPAPGTAAPEGGAGQPLQDAVGGPNVGRTRDDLYSHFQRRAGQRD